MMKSQCEVLRRTVSGIIADAGELYVDCPSECTRDLSRILRCTDTRGLGYYTLDLPSGDEFLLHTLENGSIPTSGPVTRRRSKEDARPRFLWVLWSRIIGVDGCLVEHPCPNAIFFLRSIYCLGKKVAVECSVQRRDAAVQEYHDIETSIVPAQMSWDDDCIGNPDAAVRFTSAFSPKTREDELFPVPLEQEVPIRRMLQDLDSVVEILCCDLGYFDSMSQNDREHGRFRHGPGAVADAKQGWYKYQFPVWPMKLEHVFPFDWCGSHTIDCNTSVPSRHEPPSKLICVPKTAKGPRLIASEPICHQWTQQKVASWLAVRFEQTLIGSFISLRDQTASQKLVSRASVQGDLATLDLSSASDRLSCRHVESMLRSNFSLLSAVHACRTRYVSDSIRGPSQYIRIKKFAAMGSALTFPIQSLFFLCVALASCGANNRSKIKGLIGSVRVFGDDIIVPRTSYDSLVLLLTHLGLKVNTKKSFSKGYFRESCGMDAYRGYDVTPCKPKIFWLGSPEGFQSAVDTANNLFTKGLWHASKAYEETVGLDRSYNLPIRHISSGLATLKSFVGDGPPGKTRWNPSLQRHEQLLTSLIKKSRTIRVDAKEALLHFFTDEPSRFVGIWCSGVSSNRVSHVANRWVDLGYSV